MNPLNRGPVIASGILLGAGLGGFVDGILFHQILQWHNMLSGLRPATDLPSMKYNTRWDGLFHTVTWLAVVVGLWRLWEAGKRADVAWSTPSFGGALLLGWGLFNFGEGLVAHQLLGLHHLHPGTHQFVWDIGFLVLGLIQICAGGGLIGAGSSDIHPPGSTH